MYDQHRAERMDLYTRWTQTPAMAANPLTENVKID